VRRKALKNAGYTILEMMVVVAILAVGLGIVGMSVNTIFSLEMRQCVKKLSAELGKQKVAAMTRAGEVYMRLYKDGGGIYLDKYENDVLTEQGVKVGGKKISVTYYSTSNTAGTPLGPDGIVIAFNKSNGSFKKIGQAWALYDGLGSPTYPDEYYTKLVIQSGGSSRTIVLWPDTGKFSISA
jgi:prepilin-type N-terminal cleavage/methylation domain-containing protein